MKRLGDSLWIEIFKGMLLKVSRCILQALSTTFTPAIQNWLRENRAGRPPTLCWSRTFSANMRFGKHLLPILDPASAHISILKSTLLNILCKLKGPCCGSGLSENLAADFTTECNSKENLRSRSHSERSNGWTTENRWQHSLYSFQIRSFGSVR